MFNFTGHGANNQIKDMHLIEPILDRLIDDNNKLYGNKWMACYGGDPYDGDKPDIAAVMKYVGEKGVAVLAVQCSEYGGYMFDGNGALDQKSYGFLSAAAIYETELGTPAMVPNPKKPGAMKKNIQFGGFKTDTSYRTKNGPAVLAGTTRYVFDILFGKKIKGHVACGGGPIALQEMQAAFNRGLKCLYIPTEAKYRVAPNAFQASEFASTSGYGVVHSWVEQLGLPVSLADPEWGWMQAVTMNTVDPFGFKSEWALAPQDDGALDQYLDKQSGFFIFDLGKTPSFSAAQLKAYGFDVPPGYMGLDSATKQQLQIKMRFLLRSASLQEIGIAVTLERIWDIRDKENSFSAKLYLQLQCSNGDPLEPQMPYLEWPNLQGELTPNFKDAWDAAVERHKSKKGQTQFFKFNQHFEGTFLMGNRENLSLFPYDFEEFTILLKSDKVYCPLEVQRASRSIRATHDEFLDCFYVIVGFLSYKHLIDPDTL